MVRRRFAVGGALLVGGLLLAAGATRPAAAQQRPQVVYGEDDRLDLYQVTDPRLSKLAGSTAALFRASSVDSSGEGGEARLSVGHYGRSYNLCPEEPFFEQPLGAFCSGSLVGPDLFMTAGHCVRSQSDCESTKFVFGFGVFAEGQYPDKVAASDVYSCKTLLGQEVVGTGADWALIRLDRPVLGRAPLEINEKGALEKGTPLVVIGHPAGLPTKVAGGASVRDYAPEGYFVANLDTYGGNSGSAVFNGVTGEVEGILVRGEQDYTWRPANDAPRTEEIPEEQGLKDEPQGEEPQEDEPAEEPAPVDRPEPQRYCRVTNYCPDDGCRGEDVTKVTVLADLIGRARELPDELLLPPEPEEIPEVPEARPEAGVAFSGLMDWAGIEAAADIPAVPEPSALQ